MKSRIVSRRVKTGSLLLLAFGVAGAALIHRTTHGVWFPRRSSGWAVQAPPGAAWTPSNPIPIGSYISGIWGERPDDVWAWSTTGIMHWDGHAWTRVLRPPRGAGYVVGVGESSGVTWARLGIYHSSPGGGCIPKSHHTETYDWCRVGDEWKQDGCGAPLTNAAVPKSGRPEWPVWPPDGAFVDREQLTRLWSAHPRDRSLPSLAMHHGWRIGDRDIWALDESQHWLLHFDGTRWTAATNPALGGVGAIWLADDDDGWAISGGKLVRWDGHAWKPTDDAPEYMQSVWGAAADDVWAVGGTGLVMHFDGKAWSRQWFAGRPLLTAVTGRAHDDIWIAGCDATGFAAHWDGARWTPRHLSPPLEGVAPVHNICPLLAAESGGRALAAVEDRIYELGAGGWREATSPLAPVDGAPLAGGKIAALAARGDRPSGMWAVGTHANGYLGTFDGANRAIQGPGTSPFVVRRAGDVWTKDELPETMGGAQGIWARSDDDVWVVGARGLILHFDGHAWTKEASGTDEDLVAIHGAGDSVWVLGAEGGLLRRRR